jgi:hypothetical protein
MMSVDFKCLMRLFETEDEDEDVDADEKIQLRGIQLSFI